MWRFGDFEADTALRELRCRGEVVHLEPQAFDLLVCLVEHRDRVVSKIELLDGVWGHRFVSESNLTTRVKEVRRAVGDDGTRQHTVRNVRGRGYRFVADVETARASGGDDVLIGRDAELALIWATLDRSPLVTLVGPGGAGKSALAHAVVRRAGSRWGDRVHVVELAALRDDVNVAPAVARSLGVIHDDGRLDDAARSIASLDALVVLDNCEHVADEARSFVASVLVAPTRQATILATSQVPLGVSGEAIVDVGPLSTEAARQLFAQRANAARSSWDGVDDRRLDRLLVALDRLPLTIEMAAARLRSMTFDDLERVILDEGALVVMTHRSPEPRHRSVESLVQWSVDLLDPTPRRLFAELSVFASGVTAAEAAAVVAPGEGVGSVRLALAELAERSLVVADVNGTDGETRYDMLSTVRAVAARWLEQAGATSSVRARHAAVIADVVGDIDARIRTPGEAEARGRLERVVDEVRRAHRWAQRTAPSTSSAICGSLFLAAYSSLWNEPAAWSEELLALDPTAQLPGARLVVAGAAAHGGLLAEARVQATAASGEGRVGTGALELLADVALYEGALDAVASIAIELVDRGRKAGDSHVLAFGVMDAALAHAYGGDPRRALTDLTGSDAIEGLAPSDAAWLAYARGEVLGLLGDPAAAAAFAEAIDVGRAVGNRFVVSVSSVSLADGHARAGRTDDALEAYSEALDDFVRHGNQTHTLTAVRNLVPLLGQIGDPRSAALLAGAVADDGRRASYGPESERVRQTLVAVAALVGDVQVEAWIDEGRTRQHDFDLCAADIVKRHLHVWATDPATG